jgi:plastocyanin
MTQTKPIALFALALAAAAFGSFYLAGQSGPRQAAVSLGGTQQLSAAAPQQVSLLADRAEPDTVLVEVGGSVQFNSQDGKRHEISSGKGDAFGADHEHVADGAESGVFGPDEAYLLEFKEPGTYHFHDNLNPKLNVAVVVYRE